MNQFQNQFPLCHEVQLEDLARAAGLQQKVLFENYVIGCFRLKSTCPITARIQPRNVHRQPPRKRNVSP